MKGRATLMKALNAAELILSRTHITLVQRSFSAVHAHGEQVELDR